MITGTAWLLGEVTDLLQGSLWTMRFSNLRVGVVPRTFQNGEQCVRITLTYITWFFGSHFLLRFAYAQHTLELGCWICHTSRNVALLSHGVEIR